MKKYRYIVICSVEMYGYIVMYNVDVQQLGMTNIKMYGWLPSYVDLWCVGANTCGYYTGFFCLKNSSILFIKLLLLLPLLPGKVASCFK